MKEPKMTTLAGAFILMLISSPALASSDPFKTIEDALQKDIIGECIKDYLNAPPGHNYVIGARSGLPITTGFVQRVDRPRHKYSKGHIKLLR